MSIEETRKYHRDYMRKRRANYTPKQKEIAAEKNRLNARKHKGGKPETTMRGCPDVCESCGCKPIGGRGLRLHWDHDHTTGIFRGWLCHRCNHALGFIELLGGFESPALLNLKTYYDNTMANVALSVPLS